VFPVASVRDIVLIFGFKVKKHRSELFSHGVHRVHGEIKLMIFTSPPPLYIGSRFFLELYHRREQLPVKCVGVLRLIKGREDDVSAAIPYSISFFCPTH